MTDIPKHSIPQESFPKARRTRKRSISTEPTRSGHIDETDRLMRAAIPSLAQALGASTHTVYGLRGRYGSIYREAKRELSNGDKAEYNVLVQRLEESYDRRKKFARLVLEIVSTETHQLDDQELVTEWPLIEVVGAADDVLTGAFKMFAADDHRREYDGADPEAVALLMRSHADMIIGPDSEYTPEELVEMGLYDDEDDDEEDEEDEDDEEQDDTDARHHQALESYGKAMYGQPIYRYFEKTLRVQRGAQPTLTIKAGYETDAGSFPIKLGDSQPTLIGSTIAEFDVFSQLNRESFMTIDSELVREFEDALAILGISAQVKGRRS